MEFEARQGMAGPSAPFLLPMSCENMKENAFTSREGLSDSWRATTLAFRHCWHPLQSVLREVDNQRLCNGGLDPASSFLVRTEGRY